MNVKTIKSQNSNDRQHNDAPRWYENPQFLYVPPTEYLLNAPSFSELVFPDPWEEFYDKQNQNTVHESCGGDGDGTDGHNQNAVVHSTDNCDQIEIVVDQHDQSMGPVQHTQWHNNNSNNNNNNSCSFDNAPSAAQESHSQYHHHDDCTEYHQENPAPQQEQEQEQHHHSHYHHHHDHDHHEHHENPSSHESNPHTNEPSIIEHTNHSQIEHEHYESIVPIEHETTSVHETSESNDDQVRKTFVANTTINAKRRDRKDERSH